jgi:hypothetical protein
VTDPSAKKKEEGGWRQLDNVHLEGVKLCL